MRIATNLLLYEEDNVCECVDGSRDTISFLHKNKVVANFIVRIEFTYGTACERIFLATKMYGYVI